MTRRFGLLVAVPLTAVHVNFLPTLRRSSSLVARPVFGRKASTQSPGAAAPTKGGSRRSLSGRYKEKLKPLEEETAGKFVDTHCHLDKEWRDSLEGSENDLEACVNIGCQKADLEQAASFLKYDGIYGAFGIHPLHAHDWDDEVEKTLVAMMTMQKVVAWGECGLDYFDKKTRGQVKDQKLRELQRKVFAKQMEWAVSLKKPLVVHTRFAEEDTLELMEKHLPTEHPVHVHCFTSSNTLAQALLERFSTLRLGFTGVVTFKNAPEVQEVVRNTPLERILLETDSPYMAPEPFRGRIAHPGHVSYVADKIASLKGAAQRAGATVEC
eukprot:s1135_g15.t1